MTGRNAAHSPMIIRVAIEKPDPLSGTVSAGHGEELPFEGWLGLLDALSRLVRSAHDER